MKKLLALFLGLFLISAVSVSYATTTAINKSATGVVQKVDVKNHSFLSKIFPGHTKQEGQPKSQLVALLLAVFLGGFGIHRFYLGYTTIGVIQLIMGVLGYLTSFLLIGIPILLALYVWVIIDIIRIATGTLKPADGSDYNPTL